MAGIRTTEGSGKRKAYLSRSYLSQRVTAGLYRKVYRDGKGYRRAAPAVRNLSVFFLPDRHAGGQVDGGREMQRYLPSALFSRADLMLFCIIW